MQCNCSIYATTTQIGAKHATYTRHVTSAACYKLLIALWLCSYAILLHNVVSGLHVTCTAAVFFPQCQCTMYMRCIIIMLHKLLLDYYYTTVIGTFLGMVGQKNIIGIQKFIIPTPTCWYFIFTGKVLHCLTGARVAFSIYH